MNVLVYALTIKSGGGIKVLESFMDVVRSYEEKDFKFYFVLPSSLNEKFDLSGLNTFIFPKANPLSWFRFSLKKKIDSIVKSNSIDLVYAIGAPSYYKFKVLQVLRLTEPYVLHPNRFAYAKYDFFSYIVLKFKTRVKLYFAKHELYFETQTEYAKEQILKRINSKAKVLIIRNTISNLLIKSESVSEPRFQKEFSNNKFKILCIGYPYPHKDFLGTLEVASQLLKYRMDFILYFTIPNDHHFLKKFESKVNEFKLTENVINLGVINQSDLKYIYTNSDIVYQSSLLETASATLYEALYFNKLIVCVDLPYNFEICGDCALYLTPTDYVENGNILKEILENYESFQIQLKHKKFIISPLVNFQSLLVFFRECLENKNFD
jgi:hypothetical protein